MIKFDESAIIVDLDDDEINVYIMTGADINNGNPYLVIDEPVSLYKDDALALADYIYRNFKRA